MLFVTPWYPTAGNPASGVFVREHARAAGLRHDVTVLHVVNAVDRSLRWWTVLEERDQTLTAGMPTFRLVRGRNAKSHLMKVAAVTAASRRLRPDLLHAHVYETAVPGAVAARSLDAPLVLSEHWTGFGMGLLGWRQRLQVRLGLGRAYKVLPVSADLMKAIRRYAPRSTQFTVLPNAVDTQLFFADVEASCTRMLRLLFVGLLDEAQRKNLPLLLEALSGSGLRKPWHLDVVGDGPGRIDCERMTRRLSLAPHVTFHGVQLKEQVATFMRRADLFILPSRWENLPCVVIEALASGVPVLATRVGGIPELVGHTNGRLVPPGDAEAIRIALHEMVPNLAAFDRSAISRDASRRYSIEAIGGKLDAVYRAACSSRRPSSSRRPQQLPSSGGGRG